MARLRLAGALVAGGAVLLAGCSSAETAQSSDGGGPAAAVSGSPGGSSSAGASSPSSPGAASPGMTPGASPGAAPGAPPATSPATTRVLKPGAKGDDVRALQQRLKDLHYDPGAIDGKYGTGTQMAVWAFQKVHRLKVSGSVGPRFRSALAAPRTPRPLTRHREKARVEIDLRRQLLVVYKAGEIVLITHISSGSGEYYCAKDFGSDTPRCRYAVTSTGDFRTGRRVTGWDPSPLGRLYNPVYFNGGIAVHGYPSVPEYPASHGCVRVPMTTSRLFQKLVGTNVPVHVRRPD